jgi:hypothetical protein
MERETKEKIAKLSGALLGHLTFKGLFALFVNWIVSLVYAPWYVSWAHWGITLAFLFIIQSILHKGK